MRILYNVLLSGITESFSSGVTFQYSAVASMFISSSIFYFFIAHILPVNIVGSISLLYAIMNIMAVVFVFGLSNGIQHYLSYHLVRENHSAIMRLMRQTIAFSVLLALAAFIFMYLGIRITERTTFDASAKPDEYMKIFVRLILDMPDASTVVPINTDVTNIIIIRGK